MLRIQISASFFGSSFTLHLRLFALLALLVELDLVRR